jgi:hypothetical protein
MTKLNNKNFMFTNIKTTMIRGMIALPIVCNAFSAMALNVEYDYPVQPDIQRLQRSETFLKSGKGELVPNTTYVTCSTDLDCMRVGNSLYRVSRFKGSDFSKKSVYPLSPKDQRLEKDMNYWSNK